MAKNDPRSDPKITRTTEARVTETETTEPEPVRNPATDPNATAEERITALETQQEAGR